MFRYFEFDEILLQYFLNLIKSLAFSTICFMLIICSLVPFENKISLRRLFLGKNVGFMFIKDFKKNFADMYIYDIVR